MLRVELMDMVSLAEFEASWSFNGKEKIMEKRECKLSDNLLIDPSLQHLPLIPLTNALPSKLVTGTTHS